MGALIQGVALWTQMGGDGQQVESPGSDLMLPAPKRIKWSRYEGFLWNLAVHLVLQTLPYFVWFYWQAGKTQAEIACVVALVFTILTTAYSMREIQHHLQNYFQPRIQKHIVRILLMPVMQLLGLCWVSCALLTSGCTWCR